MFQEATVSRSRRGSPGLVKAKHRYNQKGVLEVQGQWEHKGPSFPVSQSGFPRSRSKMNPAGQQESARQRANAFAKFIFFNFNFLFGNNFKLVFDVQKNILLGLKKI